MAENSKIEWTDHTFNPWIGCTKVSPACEIERLRSERQSLSDRIDVLEGEKRQVESQRRELQMLLVRYGDHEAIKKARSIWPEAQTVFDGRCLKCGGTHLGMPGGCDGPSLPSRPHPHARDMIA